MYAKADIFSCAMMEALYGTLSRLITNVKIEHWKTQLAATIRSAGIFILQFRNQTPTASATTMISKDIPNCMFTPVEKTVFSLSMSPRPSSNVMNRLMEEDIDPDKTENIATTPPTTFCIP